MTFSYDEDNDVLHVAFARPKAGVRYVETERGDVLQFCEDTNQMVGITVMYFAYRSAQGEKIEIPEVGIVAFSPAMLARLGGTRVKQTH